MDEEEEGPLVGVTVVVTRAKSQASALTEKLSALGANAMSVATIEIVPPVDGGQALADALSSPDRYAQIVVSSPNGASALAAAAGDLAPADVEGLAPVACVGPSTAARLADSPLTVNIVPDRAVAEGLVAAMAPPDSGNDRLLLVQAEVARDVLEAGLTSKGWKVDRVTGYRTIDANVRDVDREVARTGDVITFTSSSTVERFVRLVGIEALPAVVASIGPITSATAHELGLTVDIDADPHTIDGLLAALAAWAASR